MVNLGFLSVIVREVKAKTVIVRDTLDISDAEVIGLGDFGVRGSYQSPALDTTVTLTTGQAPAAAISWGDFPARAAIGVEITDPSETIDIDNDLDIWPAEDPDDPQKRIFEFIWINDPGADVEIEVQVSKII